MEGSYKLNRKTKTSQLIALRDADGRLTTEGNLNVITMVDQNDHTDLIKSENIDINDNRNQLNVRKSTRLSSTNPKNRYGKPITF